MSATQTYTPVQGARWMAKQGLRITPLSGKIAVTKGWQESATRDVETINAWAKNRPDQNYGCVFRKGEFWAVDEDIAGIIERFTAESGIVIDTLHVQSSAGRFHWYFASSPESDELLKNITQAQFKDGAASVRVQNEYCVCPFSVHPEKLTAYLPVDINAQIKPAPVEFIKWLLAQQVQPQQTTKSAAQDESPIPDGQRDNVLCSIAGKWREDGLEYDEIYPALSRVNQERCKPPKPEEDVVRIAKSVCRYPKGEVGPTVLIGGKLPGEAVVAAPPPKTSVDVLDEESVARMNAPKEKKAAQTLRYPLHVWDGTLYGDFAEVCGAKNKVAREFFAESVKTVVGSICGHRIQTKESRGQQPARFYTILIGPGGGGKSSAQKWAEEMFFGTGYLPETSQSLTFINIGAMKGCYSSATGLVEKGYAKSARLVQIYDEVTTLVEKFGINGSGDTYLDQINGMFEAGYTPQGITKTTKESTVFRGPAEHSILGCTTEVKWKNAFRKTSTEKSGFFQRLNIVTNDSEERVADFNPPDLSHLREKFIRKIAPLEYQQVEVEVLPEATELLDKWFESKQATWRDMSTDVTGRLQVLVKRNAAHIAWLLNGDEGTLDPENPDSPISATCDADVMQRAIDLSEYQERARLIHRPVLAENDYALMEGLIEQHFLKNDAPITRNNLRRTIHAERFGSKKFDDVIRTLEQDGVIQIKGLPNENRRGRKTQVIVWLGDED
jgi:hypothetical protein